MWAEGGRIYWLIADDGRAGGVWRGKRLIAPGGIKYPGPGRPGRAGASVRPPPQTALTPRDKTIRRRSARSSPPGPRAASPGGVLTRSWGPSSSLGGGPAGPRAPPPPPRPRPPPPPRPPPGAEDPERGAATRPPAPPRTPRSGPSPRLSPEESLRGGVSDSISWLIPRGRFRGYVVSGPPRGRFLGYR